MRNRKIEIDEILSIASDALKIMKPKLGLGDWDISIRVTSPEDQNFSADIYKEVEYRVATITLDPYSHPDVNEVLDSLRHELLHLVLADLDVYQHMAISGSTLPENTLSGTWLYSTERAIGNLERVFDGFGLTSSKLAKK